MGIAPAGDVDAYLQGVVIMNTNATSGVSADVRFGALAPSGNNVLAWTSFAAGVVALLGGGWLLYLARRWRRDETPIGDTGHQR